MKNKYGLLKVLLVLLAFVAAGVIYSCASSAKPQEAEITDGAAAEASQTVSGSDETADESEPEDAAVPDAALMCVHVCGAVRKPGVYYLEEGSRVHQAVEMAGGLTQDAADSYVNLADTVSDGEQIYIPTQEEAENGDIPARKSRQSEPEEDGRVNINTAGIDELTTLSGIGESRAEAIIAYRENVAPFSSVEDITNVSGIGESVFEKIKDSIKV